MNRLSIDRIRHMQDSQGQIPALTRAIVEAAALETVFGDAWGLVNRHCVSWAGWWGPGIAVHDLGVRFWGGE